MDRAIKERSSVRRTVTKTVQDAEMEVAEENPNIPGLRVKLGRLEELNARIDELDRTVLNALMDEDKPQGEVDAEMETMESYKVKIALSMMTIRDKLEPEEPVVTPPPASVAGESDLETVISELRNKCKSNLPKIQLKKFSGELKEWLGWWAQFKKINLSESIEVSDKFHYLYQATLKGSKAREVVESYPPSEENYPLVIEALTKRFGNPKLLRQLYVRELLKLVNCPVKRDGVSSLFYTLDANSRALSTLGVTTETSAEFLYPMVESCLPEELLVVWQRHPTYGFQGTKDGKGVNDEPPKTELWFLLEFLRVEVEHEEQRKLAKPPSASILKKGERRVTFPEVEERNAIVAGLFEGKPCCVFCGKSNHVSSNCFRALTMSLDEKKQKLRQGHLCFRCLKKGHGFRSCRAEVVCASCREPHFHILCPETARPPSNSPGNGQPREELTMGTQQISTEVVLHGSNAKCDGDVLLKTVVVRVKAMGGEMKVRLLFDEGSQSSYVTSYLVKRIKSVPIGVENLQTVMINGNLTEPITFWKHKIDIFSLTQKRGTNLVLKERVRIGGILPRAPAELRVEALKKMGISITDQGMSPGHREEIDILIGSDYREQLMTGRRENLGNGLFAVESVFGWVLCGTVVEKEGSGAAAVIHNYLTADVSRLWELEVLGIRDSIERVSVAEKEQQVKEQFLENLQREGNGRYIVRLPWINEVARSKLPLNSEISQKRLDRATGKLKAQGQFDVYDAVFKGWEEEGIIELSSGTDVGKGHILPHRPVFKDSETTPVRPVFDASCRVGGSPSLNQCLEKGPNMLELIPSILLRFRRKKVGVVSDIRKAFQMIGVHEDDRKFQKFLWWTDDKEPTLKEFRHSRVVFGLSCSPFILAAVLEYHLLQEKRERKETAEELLQALYVDNCVDSFDTHSDYRKFRHEATAILADAKMDLRQWEVSSEDSGGNVETSVLGLKWDRGADTLHCQPPRAKIDKVSKRNVLSFVAQIFEPIGFAAPALLPPKLMIQEAWASETGWDEEWNECQRERFQKWEEDVPLLTEVRIPRHAYKCEGGGNPKIQFHLFTDASQLAFAAAVFVRIETREAIVVQLLAAKSRVAPLTKGSKRKGKKPQVKMSIPRLELMGCLIGSRLLDSVRQAVGDPNLPTIQWTDSTTALSWIQRNEAWGTFVGNRTSEINRLTEAVKWRHVPGISNPADLPSRGCAVKELLESKWWEGPEFLRKAEIHWPQTGAEVNEDIVAAELLKTTMVGMEVKVVQPRFSSYLKNVRVAAWIRRFLNNARNLSRRRVTSPSLLRNELEQGEKDILKFIQKRNDMENRKEFQDMGIHQDDEGILRVKTKLLFKNDQENFKVPILLPPKEPLVQQLVLHVHRMNCHAGIQGTLGQLREKYWLPQGRKNVGVFKTMHRV